MKRLIKRAWYKIQLLYSWYKEVLKDDTDYDYSDYRRVIQFKLKRMYLHFTTCTRVNENKEQFKALKECIDILGRLLEDDYEKPFREAHDKKWGELKTEFVKVGGSKYSRMLFSRPKAITETEKRQEQKEDMRNFRKATTLKEHDRERLYFLLHKYEENWWC